MLVAVAERIQDDRVRRDFDDCHIVSHCLCFHCGSDHHEQGHFASYADYHVGPRSLVAVRARRDEFPHGQVLTATNLEMKF